MQRITNTYVIEDNLGCNQIYIQAKKWDRNGSVSRPKIQKFAGALLWQGATKGLYITTTKFSNHAKECAAKQLSNKIVLIDGEQIARLIIENNLGVTGTNTNVILRLDSDFFSELKRRYTYGGNFVKKRSFKAETKRKVKIDNRIFTFLFVAISGKKFSQITLSFFATSHQFPSYLEKLDI